MTDECDTTADLTVSEFSAILDEVREIAARMGALEALVKDRLHDNRLVLQVIDAQLEKIRDRQEKMAETIAVIHSEIGLLAGRQGRIEDLLKSIGQPIGQANVNPIYQCESCGKQIQGQHVMMLKHDASVAGSASPDSIAHLCGDLCAHSYEKSARTPF